MELILFSRALEVYLIYPSANVQELVMLEVFDSEEFFRELGKFL